MNKVLNHEKKNLFKDLLVVLGASVVTSVAAIAIVNKLVRVDFDDFDDGIEVVD